MAINGSEETLDHHHDDIIWGEDGKDRDVFSKALVFFVAYLAPFFYLQGIVGNIFALTVFIKSRSYKKREVVDYLIPMTIADLIFLVFSATMNWLHLDVPDAILAPKRHETNLLSTSAACKGVNYIGLTGAFCASWFIVMFTWERVILLIREKSVLNRKYRYVGIVSIIVVALLSMICIIYTWDIDDIGDGLSVMCEYAIERHANDIISYLGSFLIHGAIYALPMILVWIGNILITCKLCCRKTTDDPQEIPRRKKERKVVFQLIAISTMFLVFTTPFCILDIWGHVTEYKIDQGDIKHALLFTHFVFASYDFLLRFLYLNNCLNYLVYIISLSWFRKEARKICCCKRGTDITMRSRSENGFVTEKTNIEQTKL